MGGNLMWEGNALLERNRLPLYAHVFFILLFVAGLGAGNVYAATPSSATASKPPATSAGRCPISMQSCVRFVLRLVNRDRAQYGLPPYALTLTQSFGRPSCVGSYGHSLAMAESGTIWHNNVRYPGASFPRNICLRSSFYAENVGEAATGHELRDLSELNSLMMSEPHDGTTCNTTINHACSILSRALHRVGVGIYYASGTTWLTEDFTA